MAVLIRPRRWGQTKPAPGASIDWGHPLAQGLVSALPFNTPGLAIDYAQGRHATLKGAAKITASLGEYGLVATTQNVDYAEIAHNGTWLTGDFSYAFACARTGSTSVKAPMKQGGGGGNANLTSFYFNNLNMHFLCYTSGASARDLAADTNSTAGIVDSFVGTNRSGTMRIARNGRQGTSTLSLGSLATNTNPIRWSWNESWPGVEVMRYGYIYTRAISNAEIAWLHFEPYAFFTPPAPRISYFALDTVTLPAITAAATLPGLTAAATLAPSDPITAAATLPGLTGAATLAPADPITAAATLPALTGAAVLAPSDPMTGAATLPALTAAATLAPAAPFTGAATLPALTAAAVLGRIPAPRGVVTLEDTTARGTITVAGTTSRGRITIHDAAARGTITVE